MADSKILAYSATEIDAALGAVSGKVDKEEGKSLSTNDFSDAYKTKVDNIHALESNITSSTTIKAYVNNLSKGHYVSFYTSSSHPSDAPAANSFVEIFVYSAQTAMVRVTPVGTITDNRVYILTKSQGNWRDWYKFTGELDE